MKRNKFILSLVALGAAPTFLFSQILKGSYKMSGGFKINSGEGRIHGHIKL